MLTGVLKQMCTRAIHSVDYNCNLCYNLTKKSEQKKRCSFVNREQLHNIVKEQQPNVEIMFILVLYKLIQENISYFKTILLKDG